MPYHILLRSTWYTLRDTIIPLGNWGTPAVSSHFVVVVIVVVAVVVVYSLF